MTPDSPAATGKEANAGRLVPVVQPDGGTTGRVFTTTHGASEDLLNEGFRRLSLNAVSGQSASRRASRPTDDISFVGPFSPTPFGFNGYVKEMRPSDMAGWDAPIPRRNQVAWASQPATVRSRA